jgi:DNA-binding HxlR family transcriptional regulator
MRPAGGDRPARPDPKPPDDQALLRECWQISHFGWIPEAAIRRSLIISSGQEITAAALTERLQQLLKRGWAEERHGATGTSEREWRLTDSGRRAR